MRRHSFLFFFNDTATTEIYTLSLHDALPISGRACRAGRTRIRGGRRGPEPVGGQDACAREPACRFSRRCTPRGRRAVRSEEHTSELQSPCNLVCRLLLEKKKKITGHDPLCTL